MSLRAQRSNPIEKMNQNSHIKIGGVETFSIVDFPSQVAAVIFMQGCPWRCPFCYNQALQKIGEPGSVIWEKFVEFLKQRKKVLDAVVFSGGEPLVQNGLGEAMDEVKALGYKIGLHTGGYRPSALEKVLTKVDWIGFDIKAPLEEERYKKVVGSANHLKEVEKSLKIIIDSNIDFECRTTCDPRILSIDDISKIADSLKALGVQKYSLQKYRPLDSDKTTQDAECEKFFHDEKLRKYLEEKFASVEFRK